MMQPHPILKATLLAAFPLGTSAATTVAGFEDVSLPTPYPGPGGGAYYNGSDEAGGFTSRGTEFPNAFTDFGGGFTSWSGFAVSSTTDSLTPGFGNQYSAVPGAAFSGAQYAIAFASESPVVSFGGPLDFANGASVSLTNTTYAALSMQNGDAFAKQFGGADGSDPDFFAVTIEGLLRGSPVGAVEFFLADYRFADDSQDFIVDQWTVVDLSSLGTIDALRFTLDSSDRGPFGINTPTYFAMDDLTVPEPGTAALALLGLTGLLRRRRVTSS